MKRRDAEDAEENHTVDLCELCDSAFQGLPLSLQDGKLLKRRDAEDAEENHVGELCASAFQGLQEINGRGHRVPGALQACPLSVVLVVQ